MPSMLSCSRLAVAAAFALLLGTGRVSAQATVADGSVAGVVVAAGTDAPIPEVQISVQGTRIAGRSNDAGRFRLTGLTGLAGTEVTLEARRVGFRPVTVRVAVGGTTIRIVMTTTPLELGEIVITGQAGAVERRSIGNTISTISAATDLRASGVATIGALINGRAPGVVVTSGTGRAGAGTSLNIRGRSTLSLSQQPLIYIDGVRVSNDVNTGPRTQGGAVTSRLDDIAPEDIESIEIIKGPAAGTLYGTEASNGVVQIITKKGGSGAPSLSVSIRQGTQWFQNAEGRMATNFFRATDGTITSWNAVQAEEARGTPLFRSGALQTYAMNLRGGLRNLNYYLSSSYDRDAGIEPSNRLSRYTGHANLSIAPSEKYDIATSLHIIKGTTLLGADFGLGRFFISQYGSPAAVTGPTRGFIVAPPEAVDAYLRNSQAINRYTGSIQLNHRPTTWIAQRLIIGLDQTSEDNQALRNFLEPRYAVFFTPTAAQGGIAQDLRNVSYITMDYSGTATNQLWPTIKSAFSLGAQFYRRRSELTQVTASQFPAPGLTTAAAAAVRDGSQDFVTNSGLGMYVQEQITWRDRLFVTGAVRVDNNSAFGSDVKMAMYPKLSASWVVSDEEFWGIEAIDQLRLRAAYGLSGQQPEAFAALQTYAPTTGPGNRPIVTPQFPGNPSLKPERGEELEAGFEASLFRRIGIDFTYFNKHTRDAILSRASAPSSGFPNAQFVNIGMVSNHGVELSVTANAFTRGRIAWDVGASVATTEDRIEDMGGLPFITVGLPFHRNQVNFPIGGFFTKVVTSADYDPVTRRAINAMCDGGVDSRPGGTPVPCATAPMLFFGTITPKASGAIKSTLTLGRWVSLHGMADFRKGNKLFSADVFNRCAVFNLCEANVSPETVDPRELYTYQNGTSLTVTDAFIKDASFWRLREVSATLNGPDRLARYINASSVSLTLAGRNLHTWTKYPGLDPESRSPLGIQNIAFAQAVTPSLAQFVSTLRITF